MAEPELRLRSHDLDWQRLDDETVALDLRGSKYLAINGSGSYLWTRLADGSTRSALVADLVERYAIDVGRAGADVDAFLDMLRAHSLLSES